MPKDADQIIGQTVSRAEMQRDLRPERSTEHSANTGPQRYAFSIAIATRIDYAMLTCHLKIQTGETITFEAVPLTFPGAGNRHFFGAMPQPGDVCVVGWGMQDSGHTRRPFIVSWLVPGAVAGYDWLPTQPYTPDEFGLSPKLRNQLEGIADRIRHKLRMVEPGNILAASAQGSEMLLDESVHISNRRGNEIRLRDQDQALVTRSLQQFHTGAGFRIYSGMVQRDAKLLPKQVFSDGIYWAAPGQVDAQGNQIEASELGEAPYPEGFLTPDQVFQRDEDGNLLSGIAFSSDLDPYDVLQRGRFISEDGYEIGDVLIGRTYGGKPIFRASTAGFSQNATDEAGDTAYTEYRVEVSHTSNGTLPVTEQTDGFDADRLPTGSPRDPDPLATSAGRPLVEFVMGTVVGNDAFSEKGSHLYGAVLAPVIFDGDVRDPKFILADYVAGTGGLGIQAASLFRVTPPNGGAIPPTFWSVTKDGRLKASISGPSGPPSIEAATRSGVRLGFGATDVGESLNADLDGAMAVRARRGGNADNVGIRLTSDLGAIHISAGGSTTVGGASARQTEGTDADLPGLLLESSTNTVLKASRSVSISAPRLDLTNVQQMSLSASTSLDFQSAGGISHSSDTYTQATTGKSTFVYSGPKAGNPANGPVRDTDIITSPATGFPGGVADQYHLLYGDRDEEIEAGNHTTSVLVGNQTYAVGVGTFEASAQGTKLKMSATGADLSTTFGSIQLSAPAGGVSIQASTGITLRSNVGNLALDAPFITILRPVGTHHVPPQVPASGILTDGVIDLISGQPWKNVGMVGVQSIQVT